MSTVHLDALPKQNWAALFDAPAEFLSMLPLPIYACEVGGRIRWFNARAAKLWGRTPRIDDSKELFCGAQQLYDLDAKPIIRETSPMALVLKTGEPVHGKEIAFERPDGSRIVAMVHIDPVRDDDGKLIGAISCFHDTTELHRVRTEIAEGAERFRQVLEALPAAIYTTDAEGRITFYNNAAAELAGHKPTLGTDEWCVTWRLQKPDGTPLPHDQCPMAVTLRENRPIRGMEALAERPDGVLIPIAPFPTPLRDLSGKLVGAVNMLVDTTDRKAAEAQQKILFDELNHRVKNNMQMLHSLLRIAERETQNPEARAALSEAAKRVGAMASAQQVLYDAKNPNHFNVGDFFDKLCQTARQTFGKNADIGLNVEAGKLPNNTAVPLSLILNELLSNAVKHGMNGRDRVAIHIALAKKNANDWQLGVRDDGPGFAPEQFAKRSSGLGLVAGLAKQLGGNLEISTAAGTSCMVTFPQQQSAIR